MALAWVPDRQRVMVGTMNLPCIMFIPDRFTDYRMWSDIPDRIQGRAEIIHFDQGEQIPWMADSSECIDAARRLAPDGGFDIVAAAGQAARFAFAIAEAGLAKGLVFFQPRLDRVPADVDVDFSELDEVLEPYQPVVEAIHEPDPARWREIMVQVLRDTAAPDAEPAQLELAIAILSDHAEELFTDLQATAAAQADGRTQPDPPWVLCPWYERLTDLTLPVTAVVAERDGYPAEPIARRAKDADIVVASSDPPAPADDRARAAAALLRMLDRIS